MTTSAPIPPAMLTAATEAILAKDDWTPDFPATPPSDVREKAKARADAALAAVGYGELVAALAQVTALARIKYGNLDKDVDEYLTGVEKLLARVHGEASEEKQ